MEIFGIDITIISIIVSFLSLVIAIIAILVSYYTSEKVLNIPDQRESIKSFIWQIDNEIDKHKKLIEPKGNAHTLDYLIYYNNEESPNNAISGFVDLLKKFKKKPEYQSLNQKHKKEINKMIGEWSNYDSKDVCSPEAYISKMEEIRTKFLNFL